MPTHLPHCPLCGHTRGSLRTKDYRGCNGNRAIYTCQSCGVLFIYSPNNIQEQKEFYDDDRQLKQTMHRFSLREYESKIRIDTQRRVRFCSSNIPPASHVLDVGCGYGYFIFLLNKQGYAAEGIDPSSIRISTAKEFYGIRAVEGFLDSQSHTLPKKYYDAITAWHVLEHVSEPHHFIEAIKDHLLPGGLLIIELPSASDILLKYKPYSRFVLQDAHCIYYRPKHIKMILRQHGFINIKVRSIQRYGLANALQWLVRQTPEINDPSVIDVASFSPITTDKLYGKLRSLLGGADTILAKAQLPF